MFTRINAVASASAYANSAFTAGDAAQSIFELGLLRGGQKARWCQH